MSAYKARCRCLQFCVFVSSCAAWRTNAHRGTCAMSVHAGVYKSQECLCIQLKCLSVKGKPTGNIRVVLGGPHAALVRITQPPSEGILIDPRTNFTMGSGTVLRTADGAAQLVYQVRSYFVRCYSCIHQISVA